MKSFPLKSLFVQAGLGVLSVFVLCLFYLAPVQHGFLTFRPPLWHKTSLEPLTLSRGPSFGSALELPQEQENTNVESLVRSPKPDATFTLRFKHTHKLQSLFKQRGFQLSDVEKGRRHVPRIYLDHFPKDWCKSRLSGSRHILFVKMILPLILEENERVLADRSRAITLFQILNQGHSLDKESRTWLKEKAQAYRVRPFDRSALLAKMDSIPPSLALAQAILESGFGRSTAAMQKNSIFGHMATSTAVRSYPNLRASVTSYIQNLNKHRAYRSFHRTRSQMRREGKLPSGFMLTNDLKAYCERGAAYIRELQYLIRRHRLERFDTVFLEPIQ